MSNTNETAQTGKQLRVLIVDDSAAVRESIQMLCDEIHGLHVVDHAQDGLEGLAAIEKLRPDVVILDIRMPRMTGLELLSALESRPERPLLIVFSALPHEVYRPRCLALKAAHFFEKPKDLEQLDQVLRQLVQRHGKAS